MEIPVTFAGGRVVEAVVGDHVVRTDQPVSSGGSGTAPSPFNLFLASIATCAGFYVLDFCLKREISLDDLGLTLTTSSDPESRMIKRIVLQVRLPATFPEKYEQAVVRAAELCSVKKHLQQAPDFETVAIRS
jgi:putative redox protein